MLKDKILQYFHSDPNLKVLFLFDPEGQYKEQFDTLNCEDILYVEVSNNYFTIKHKLYREWANEKVFLYFQSESPYKTGNFLQFPLLDILEANREIISGSTEAFLEEFKLARSYKNLVKKYIKELQYVKIQDVCRPVLQDGKLDEASLQQGLISAFLKFSSIASWPVIMAKILLMASPEKKTDLQRFVKKIHELDLEFILFKKLTFYFGNAPQNVSQEYLKEQLCKIRYNQITYRLAEASPNDPYGHLKIKDKSLLTNIFQMVQESSTHSQINGRMSELLDWVGEVVKGDKIIEIYGSHVDYGFLNDEMAWAILNEQLDKIEYNPRSVIQVLTNISSSGVLSQSVKDTISFVIQLASMLAGINNIKTYTLNTPDEYISIYVKSWSEIDRAYRKAINLYKRITNFHTDFDPDGLYILLNKRYEVFIETSNREWIKCFSEIDFDYAALQCPKQFDFFRREIESSDVKTVVIVSDALRYEAAEELLGMLHSDTKNVAVINHQLASIPSKTSIGMAQLLPGKHKLFNRGKITIEGHSTEGIENRQKIISLYDNRALAIQFSSLESFSLKQSREIFKSPVVYVYHDVIDATGDKKASERRTFKAVDDALEELAKFINKLHHTYNVTKVFITADHGFLYNDQEIDEKDKEPSACHTALTTHNRYEIVDTNIKPKLGYRISLKNTTMFQDTENLSVIIPESTNRYKKQGVGHQFVHGGASLQELVVPVITSYRKSQSIAKKVKPIIANASHLKIVSNILRVSILQDKKVSREEKEIELSIALYKGNEIVSNEVQLLLNSVSEEPTGRIQKIELLVNPSASKDSFLKLKIFDIEDRLNSLVEIRVSNQTLIQPDF